MDIRVQTSQDHGLISLFKNIYFLAVSLLLLANVGCGNQDRVEALMPLKTETCNGAAITSKYIVHFTNGTWDYVQNPAREKFKNDYVKPQAEKIDFIEYDQKVLLLESAKINQNNVLAKDTQTAQQTPTLISATSGIDNWGAQSINAAQAWQKNAKGAGVIVAVIDTGVDIFHPQLSPQIYINSKESGANATNGIDDDGNGLIDDYAGYNFLDNSNSVVDDVGHGTHVSGIIAAQHSDLSIKTGYMQGVAPDAKILPIKFLGANGGQLSDALKGIDYAISRGASVINASWGGPGCSQSLRQKISDLSAKNVLFVSAAGNNGQNLDLYPEYPAAFNLPLQVTVGAIKSTLMMDGYSNYSPSLVHLFAPGTAIVSTVPGNGYASMSGTSMATPFVSGALAAMISYRPNLGLAAIRNNLFQSVDSSSAYINLSQGRLNLGAAIDALGQSAP